MAFTASINTTRDFASHDGVGYFKRQRPVDEDYDIESTSCNKRSLSEELSKISFQIEDSFCEDQEEQCDDLGALDEISTTDMACSSPTDKYLQLPGNVIGPKSPDIFGSPIRKPHYSRKVDFLIDEVIRKSRQKLSHAAFESEIDGTIPSAVGPHPLTDHAISVAFPLQLILCEKKTSQKQTILGQHKEVSSFQARRDSMDDLFVDCDECGSYESKTAVEGEGRHSYGCGMKTIAERASYSGSVTHSDWIMEEVSLSR